MPLRRALRNSTKGYHPNYPNGYSKWCLHKHQFEKARCPNYLLTGKICFLSTEIWNLCPHLVLERCWEDWDQNDSKSIRRGQSTLWPLRMYLIASAGKRTSPQREVDPPDLFAPLLLIKLEERRLSYSFFPTHPLISRQN